MSNYICFLITLYDGQALLRCALKVDKEKLSGDCAEFPLEPENKLQLFELLPEHVRGGCVIVDVDEIFEVVI